MRKITFTLLGKDDDGFWTPDSFHATRQDAEAAEQRLHEMAEDDIQTRIIETDSELTYIFREIERQDKLDLGLVSE